MSTIHDLSRSTIGPLRGVPHYEAPRRAAEHAGSRFAGIDALELSDEARRFADDAPIRHERVQQVRLEIARGEYLTDENLEAAIDRLIDDALG